MWGHPLASVQGQPSIVPDYDAQAHEPGRQVRRPRLLKVRQVDAAGRNAPLITKARHRQS